VLPANVKAGQIELRQALIARRSRGEFGGGALDLETLSGLLALGARVSRERTSDDGARWSLRTAPSGGALYPIDLICLVHRIDGVDPGTYLYEPRPHALLPLRHGDSFDDLTAATYLEGLDGSAVAFVLVGVFGRSRFKYGERGYRFVLLEAGHIAQNILLAAEAADLAALPVGGFEDDEVNRLVRADGIDEAAVYVIVVGGRSGCSG
jgi:SagB-type dehydrogenase family enzyme